MLEIVWLGDLLQQQQQSQPGGSSSSSVFSHIPESVLSDAASWLTFVIQMREAEQVAGACNIGETQHLPTAGHQQHLHATSMHACAPAASREAEPANLIVLPSAAVCRPVVQSRGLTVAECTLDAAHRVA